MRVATLPGGVLHVACGSTRAPNEAENTHVGMCLRHRTHRTHRNTERNNLLGYVFCTAGNMPKNKGQDTLYSIRKCPVACSPTSRSVCRLRFVVLLCGRGGFERVPGHAHIEGGGEREEDTDGCVSYQNSRKRSYC